MRISSMWREQRGSRANLLGKQDKASVSVLRIAVALTAVVLLAACDKSGDGTGPDDRETLLDSVANNLPPGVADFLRDEWNRLEPVTVEVWAACARNGTVGMTGTPYRAGVNCRFALVDGYPRRFVVYVPPGHTFTPERLAPVVVMHHGSSGNGEQFLNISGWREEADEHGFITAFPTGLLYALLDGGTITKWNSFELASLINPAVKPPGYPGRAPWPADDVAFESTILDDLENPAAIDARRFYAAGFSNGAQFTGRLGVELSNRFAAVGLFGGALDAEYQARERISVIMGFGLEDHLLLEIVNATLASQSRPPLTRLPLAPDSLAQLTDVNGFVFSLVHTFDFNAEQFNVLSDQQTFSLISWNMPRLGSPDGHVLTVAALARVGHQFPRGPRPGKPQNNPLGFDAADRFWTFFAEEFKR